MSFYSNDNGYKGGIVVEQYTPRGTGRRGDRDDE